MQVTAQGGRVGGRHKDLRNLQENFPPRVSANQEWPPGGSLHIFSAILKGIILLFPSLCSGPLWRQFLSIAMAGHELMAILLPVAASARIISVPCVQLSRVLLWGLSAVTSQMPHLSTYKRVSLKNLWLQRPQFSLPQFTPPQFASFWSKSPNFFVYLEVKHYL